MIIGAVNKPVTVKPSRLIGNLLSLDMQDASTVRMIDKSGRNNHGAVTGMTPVRGVYGWDYLVDGADDSRDLIDRVFESCESAQVEYDRLVALESTSVSGSVLYEQCDHFGTESGCTAVASKSWGEVNE